MGELESSIKNAFSKVKEDINQISEEFSSLKALLVAQKDEINNLKAKLNLLEKTINDLKNHISTGNDGVNQSINHLINQSINQSSDEKTPNSSKWLKNEDKRPYDDNNDHLDHPLFHEKILNQSINQSPNNQSFNQSLNQMQKNPIKQLTNDINKVFLALSKQELKLFLTVYQFEEDGLEPSYRAIGDKMQLSEHCIRSHISAMFRKNIPLTKKRLNNKMILIFIPPDFKALNLKQKIINLYYGQDIYQKTLFDS